MFSEEKGVPVTLESQVGWLVKRALPRGTCVSNIRIPPAAPPAQRLETPCVHGAGSGRLTWPAGVLVSLPPAPGMTPVFRVTVAVLARIPLASPGPDRPLLRSRAPQGPAVTISHTELAWPLV